MFNKRKAGDVKYCHKKIDSDIKNLQYVDIAAVEAIFNLSENSEYREWTYNLAKRASQDESVITAIKGLPMERQRSIVESLVTWDGGLITKFGETYLNDPKIATAAIGPDHVLNMPTKLEEHQINRDGDTEIFEVIDYSKLKARYDLFPLLGEQARDQILRMHTLLSYTPEDDKYLADHIPQSFISDLKNVRGFARQRPFIYNALSEEFKRDPEVICSVLDTRYSKDAGAVLQTLSQEERKEVLSRYKVGWYSYDIPEGLDFVFKNKQDLMIVLENNALDNRVLDKMDKELLKDPEVAKKCVQKITVHKKEEIQKFYETFPKEVFDKGENVAAFVSSIGSLGKGHELVEKLVNDLSQEEFEKAARINPKIIPISTKHEKNKIREELIKTTDISKLDKLMYDIGGIEILPRELQIEVLARDSSYAATRFDRELLVEAAMRNSGVIERIKNPQLRSDVLIEYTTLKYLEKKFVKITSEKELDELIARVKKHRKPKVNAETKATKTAEPNKKNPRKK